MAVVTEGRNLLEQQMAEDLRTEIEAAIHDRLRVRDVSKAIWEAVVNEVSQGTWPAPTLWRMRARINSP